jgi:hypothetical protein
MKTFLRKAGLLMLSGMILTTAACTTIKPVYNVDQTTYAGQLEPGDRVRLSYLDGRVREINVTEVSETEIKGTIHKNTPSEPRGRVVAADWQDIHAVETVKISALKTVGAGVGIVVAIPFLVVGAVFMGAGS